MASFVGKVVSNRMQKSVLIAVDRLKAIPKYKRTVMRQTKLMAHDEKDECNIGDTVRINSCRPLSKNKSFLVVDILRKEKVFDAQTAAQAAKQRHHDHQAPPADQ